MRGNAIRARSAQRAAFGQRPFAVATFACSATPTKPNPWLADER
jgi:hypothetical protein